MAHEALLREWGRLRRWLDEDREFLFWQQRLRAGLHQWETSEYDDGALLRGAPLAEAKNWLNQRRVDLNKAERELEVAQELAQEAEARRQEAEAAQTEAKVAQKEAEQEARRAKSSHLSALAQAMLDRSEDPTWSLPLLLARKAVLTTLIPDGYVTAEADAILRVAVDTAPLAPKILRGHLDFVRSATFSPDSQLVLTASGVRRFFSSRSRLYGPLVGCAHRSGNPSF